MEVAKALDEVVAHLLPSTPDQQQAAPVAPQQVSPTQSNTQDFPQACNITPKVNQIVIRKWTKISLGEIFKSFHPFSSWTLWDILHSNLILLNIIFYTLKIVHIYLYRILLPLLMTLTTILGMNCELTTSVVFYPVDNTVEIVHGLSPQL